MLTDDNDEDEFKTDQTFNYYTSVHIPPAKCLHIFAPGLSSTLFNADKKPVSLFFVFFLVI